MGAIEGMIDYQRREYCKDIGCPIQLLLDDAAAEPAEYDRIRAICQSSCIHTTYEFHHWLIDKGYLIMRPG